MKKVYQLALSYLIVVLLFLVSSLSSISAPKDSSTTKTTQSVTTKADPVVTSDSTAGKTSSNEKSGVSDNGQTDGSKHSDKWKAPPPLAVYIIIGFVLFGSFFAMMLIRSALIDSNWQIGDALSEEVEINLEFRDKDGNADIKVDKSDKPLTAKVLRASVSRLIALMGMMVILLVFLGFGIFALYSFANTGMMPESTDKVIKFLAGGLTLFAPYVANKFSGIFDSFAPKSK